MNIVVVTQRFRFSLSLADPIDLKSRGSEARQHVTFDG
jgi:hypothetical protein